MHKTIYIDSEFKCHATNLNDEYRAFEDQFFDNMCDEAIEGFRYVPLDEKWVRDDGQEFNGKMIIAWKPYEEIEEIQRKYEKDLIAKYKETLSTMGVNI